MDQRERFSEATALLATARVVFQTFHREACEAASLALVERALALVEAHPEARKLRRRVDVRRARDQSVPLSGRVAHASRIVSEHNGAEAWAAMRDAKQAELDVVYARWEGLRRAFERELDDAAQGAEVRASRDGSERELIRVWTSSYSTQGYGASRYAKSSAESVATNAQSFGVRARVERMADSVRDEIYNHTEVFVVYVATDSDLDVEILKRKRVDMREWVRACWTRGVNPRVYNPFLPADYEERVGLDFFGGESKVSQVAE